MHLNYRQNVDRNILPFSDNNGWEKGVDIDIQSYDGFVKTYVNPQGNLDKEDLCWVDDKVLYKHGEAQTLEGITLTDDKKVLAKMGAYIIIMPDRVWCKTNDEDNNLECGYMENKTEVKGVTISICEASGKAIEWHDADYYEDLKEANEDIPD